MSAPMPAAVARNWNALIDDVVGGTWLDPETGEPARVPFNTIHLAENLEGSEAELVAPLKLGRRIAIVSDTNTVEVLGARVARSLRELGTVDEIVLSSSIACDEPTVALLQERSRHADALVAVGSGVLSDTVKYATFKSGRPYACFGTAASMNGYAATTASVTLANGFKVSLAAHAPRGVFLDLAVSAAAPVWLSAAGLGDSLCRATAQIDWWAAHRLFATPYSRTPYALQSADEPQMLELAARIASHDLEAVGVLQRVLTLCGLGVCFTGTSHHGSMGEHQVSHWLDMFAGRAHPGSTHGQQVGVASLAIHRLQHELLALPEAPVIRPTRIDEAAMLQRYGPKLGPYCIAEFRKKSLDAADARGLNNHLAALWPALRTELAAFALPPAAMHTALKAAGGPTTATELGLSREIWRDAMKYGREIRNRWSFLDLADDAGLLDDFLDRDPQ